VTHNRRNHGSGRDVKSMLRANSALPRASNLAKDNNRRRPSRGVDEGGRRSLVARTVLVADEDVQARNVAEKLLCPRGLAVRFADDGAEADEVVRHECIALVVLDVDRPEMNGFDLLRRLQGRFESPPPARRPRILVVTARRDAAVKRFARRLGADAVLCKPLVPERFTATAERLSRATARRAA
jgi:CheY-like chemotaxis protein